MISAPDIPGHSITSVLGSGGFATVYRGWQVAVGREVAVKVDSRVLLSERDRRRFFREVTAAGRPSGHPHVIDVYDAGTLADGRPYLVMELCPAGSLADELRRSGPMSAERVRTIGIAISEALAAAHAAGVLHRDIKVVMAAGLALVIVAAIVIGIRVLAPGARPQAPGTATGTTVGSFGIPTTASGCAAASVAVAAARCPQRPECWNGVVDISGDVTDSPLPCTQPHSWETFAIAMLPADVATFDQDIVAANPAVQAVCSLRVLLRSRQPQARLIPLSSWQIFVMPPDEAAFGSGARAYRCLAAPRQPAARRGGHRRRRVRPRDVNCSNGRS